MNDNLLRTLQGLRPTILERWEVLLRAEPVTSPLANPDSLVYLMGWTLDRFFTALRGPLSRRRITGRGSNRASLVEERELCACKMNPLLAYFATAELALIQAALPMQIARENTKNKGQQKLRGLAEHRLYCAIRQSGIRKRFTISFLRSSQPNFAVIAVRTTKIFASLLFSYYYI